MSEQKEVLVDRTASASPGAEGFLSPYLNCPPSVIEDALMLFANLLWVRGRDHSFKPASAGDNQAFFKSSRNLNLLTTLTFAIVSEMTKYYGGCHGQCKTVRSS